MIAQKPLVCAKAFSVCLCKHTYPERINEMDTKGKSEEFYKGVDNTASHLVNYNNL